MSTATDKSVTVYFDPTAINKQSDVVLLATLSKAGLMSPAQVAELIALIAGAARSFQDTFPANDDDVTFTIPVAKRPADGNYAAVMTIQSGNVVTGYTIPFADQTASSLRVLLDGQFPVNTTVAFTITPL